MFGAYAGLLEALGSDEAAWRDTGRCLTPPVQLAARAEVNATAAGVPPGLLHDAFVDQAARRPGAEAVLTADRSVSYGELDRLSNRLAHRLRTFGARRNQLVAVVMEKGWEQVAAVLAVLKSGAAYLPIDAETPAERLSYLLSHGEVAVALTQPKWTETIAWPSEVSVIAVTPEAEPSMSEAAPAPVRSPDDLAYVIFTSGSTGVPKGVMIDHRGAWNTVTDVNRRFGVGSEDRVLALSALHFDLSVWDVFGVLGAGGAVVVPSAEARRDPFHWAELVARHGVTIWNTVPALMELFVEFSSRRGGDLGGLRLVMMSGDWIPVTLPDRIRRLSPGIEVVSLGGATEASIWSILHPIGEVDPAWPSIPYGRPMTNQTLRVLGADLAPCPVWVPGELYIGGVGLARGYWKDEEKTAASFLVHPVDGERLYRTGDLGRYLPSGDIEFLGREDFQVKIQGHRIELTEIEVVLVRHPRVRDAAVTAPGERSNRRLVAYVVAERQAELDGDELRDFLASKLPAYMVPGTVVVLDEMPLTSNGKVDRAALERRELADVGAERAAPYVAPRTPREEQLAAVWAEVLGVDQIGIADNFFELGGDSVMAIQVTTRLAAVGLRLTPTAIFEHQTIGALVEEVREIAHRGDEPSAVPEESEGLDVEAAGVSEDDLEALFSEL